MYRNVTKACLTLIAVFALAISASVRPASATSIGTLDNGTSYSDTITSNGPTFSQDYTFHLNGAPGGVSVLATAFGQNSADYGVNFLKISLYDATNVLIATASGAPITWFDSFAQSGMALGAGDYLFNVMGNVTTGKQAFVSISLAANGVAKTPIPASGLLLLTGVGLLGGLAVRRSRTGGVAL